MTELSLIQLCALCHMTHLQSPVTADHAVFWFWQYSINNGKLQFCWHCHRCSKNE